MFWVSNIWKTISQFALKSKQTNQPLFRYYHQIVQIHNIEPSTIKKHECCFTMWSPWCILYETIETHENQVTRVEEGLKAQYLSLPSGHCSRYWLQDDVSVWQLARLKLISSASLFPRLYPCMPLSFCLSSMETLRMICEVVT